ncbi:MAG: 50S ribosomal protein L4, partial [Candidatus Omnitrophota bacterium]|nr:50S ribosomal protein L4 [Candidatus Omnitrophota bacterium]
MKAKTKKDRAKKAKLVVAEARTRVRCAKDSQTPKEFAIPLYDMSGKEVGAFTFNKKIFTGQVHKGALYQAVLMYNANKRQGNASTKTRGDVSGGGKKPWRQKGTGRARAGSSRSPLWRGGGAVFGPHTRDFHYTLPKKIKRLAFVSSINSKLHDSKVIGIDTLALEEPK